VQGSANAQQARRHGAQQYRPAQLERSTHVAHHPEMDAAPSRIVSVVLGLIMLAAIFLWSGFIFAPTWLDRLLSF